MKQWQRRHVFGLSLFLALLLLGGTAPPGAVPALASPQKGTGTTALSWRIEAVDAPKYFDYMGSRSLVLGHDGYPRIAYGADHLYYARYDGTTWWCRRQWSICR